MTEEEIKDDDLKIVKVLVNEGRLDDAVEEIKLYLENINENNYLDRMENVLETLVTLHGGRTILRFLIEHSVIDIPTLLHNLSKKDSMLRYSFLLLLKSMCENEADLFLPYVEDLLQSEDPNIKEAILQLLIFISGGEKDIKDESIIRTTASKLINEKEFVTEKAIQALRAVGKDSPSLIAKILTEYIKENSENEELRKKIDTVLKSIVSVEKIDELVEEEKSREEEKKEEDIDVDEKEITDKELELKKKDLELKKKKLELEAKEKELEEKEIQEKEKALKKKQELLEKEKELSQVELELKQKEVEERQQKIREEEAKRLQEKIRDMKEKENE
ncbi:MAG: hypothetical protein GF311_13265 [Candidatus Lokiarchaeota archaeon]|nr:hypothetical protein [Candidatus Lokiarchaeota archaeon]